MNSRNVKALTFFLWVIPKSAKSKKLIINCSRLGNFCTTKHFTQTYRHDANQPRVVSRKSLSLLLPRLCIEFGHFYRILLFRNQSSRSFVSSISVSRWVCSVLVVPRSNSAGDWHADMTRAVKVIQSIKFLTDSRYFRVATICPSING